MDLQAQGGEERAPAQPLPNALQLARIVLVPALAFAALHVRALDFPLVWTDVSAIGGGTMLREPGELVEAFGEPLHRIEFRGASAGQAYYRPLQVVLLSAVRNASDGEPRRFRAAAIAVGALCMAAWGWLALRLLGGVGAALFAGSFVAVHPAAIESTTWISGVSGTLCALFSIASIALALRCVRAARAPAAWLSGGLCLLALLAGLLSKERAAVAPALLAATLVAVARAGRPALRSGSRERRRALLLVLGQAVLAIAFMALWRPWVLGDVLPTVAPIGDSWVTQFATALSSWPASMAWIFVPFRSTTSDVLPVVSGLADWRPWLGAAVALGSAAAALLLFQRGRPVAALGLAWIWIAFAPTSGLLPMLHLTGERYRFLSCFGAALVVADLVPALLVRITGARRPVAAGALAVLGIGLLAGRTWERVPDWRSTESLFGGALDRDPAYREAYFLLASDAVSTEHFELAAERVEVLLAQPERFAGTTSYLNWLSTYELACSVELARGRFDAALALEQRTARENPGVARSPTFRACVGQAYGSLGRTAEAVKIYTEVARELGAGAPPRLLVMATRGLMKLGRWDEARVWLSKAQAATTGMPNLQRQTERLAARLREATGH